MTMPASSEMLQHRLPSDAEVKAADSLRKIISANDKLRLLDEQGEQAEITLAPTLSRLLMSLLRHVSAGEAVTLVPYGQKLTTQQAADILNVSRPHFIKLLEKGELPYELVGRHRRVNAKDLFAYKQVRDEQRDKALSVLAEMDAELI